MNARTESGKKKELYGLLDMMVEKVSVTAKTSERTAWQQENHDHSFLVVCLHQPAKHTVAVEYFYSAERFAFMISAVYISSDNGKIRPAVKVQLQLSHFFLFISCCSCLVFFSLSFNIRYMTARYRQGATGEREQHASHI